MSHRRLFPCCRYRKKLGNNVKQKRTKRLRKVHESQPLTMWRDDTAALCVVYSHEELEGSALIVHNNYGMVFCVGNNWEPA